MRTARGGLKPFRRLPLYLSPAQPPTPHHLTTLHSLAAPALRRTVRRSAPSFPQPAPPKPNGASPSRPGGRGPRRAVPARPLSRAGPGARACAAARARAGAWPPPPQAAPPAAAARPRTARRWRVVLGSRHLLRRRRRVRHHGRGVWVRQPLQPGVRHQHGGAEHGALQQRPQLRRLLRGALRRGGRREPLVPAGLRRGDGHQLLPSQQRAPLRRRRLVQPAPRPLRHVAARVPAHRALQGRHCPRLLPQGRVQQEGRHPVHNQRPFLLQPGAGDQRGRRRRRARGGREGRALRGVAGAVAQLGPELAEQHAPGRASALVPRHHQRRPLRGLQQRRPPRLGLRPDLQRRPVQLNTRHPVRSRSVVVLSTQWW